jgi:hypothetical protein
VRTLILIVSIALVVPAWCFAQQTTPFTPDSTTRGLWHFDETSGSILLDASGAGNNGTVSGPVIVPGRFGNARSFDGINDYISIPSNKAFDFDTSSFRIDLWFKTAGQQSAIFLRRGLAPDPGYMMSEAYGRVVAMIGSREDRFWPDTLISAWSDSTYGDNQWHLMTMVRDRSVHKLFLYVDGILATQPVEDPFILPINSSRPLTLGRWESDVYPAFYNGLLDEVRLSSPKLLPPSVVIHVQPGLLDFGNVKIGSTDTLFLNISNSGFQDTLRVSSVTSTNPKFKVPGGPLLVAPGKNISVPMSYVPTTTTRDTTLISIASNDPVTPRVDVRAQGKGFAFTAEPIIEKLTLIPYTYYQIRLGWLRSMYDSAAVADPVTDYSIWRLVPGSPPPIPANRPGVHTAISSVLNDPSWEFVASVPAIGFDRYSCVIAPVVDNTRPSTQNVIVVAARTKNLQAFLSHPDTVLIYPGYFTGIGEGHGRQTVNAYMLSQNFPNPFNPSTVIRYGLPGSAHVILSVFNSLGQQVATLVQGDQEAGEHEVRFDAGSLSSGVYFYRIQAGDFVQTKRLLLLK